MRAAAAGPPCLLPKHGQAGPVCEDGKQDLDRDDGDDVICRPRAPSRQRGILRSYRQSYSNFLTKPIVVVLIIGRNTVLFVLLQRMTQIWKAVPGSFVPFIWSSATAAGTGRAGGSRLGSHGDVRSSPKHSSTELRSSTADTFAPANVTCGGCAACPRDGARIAR
jgi:hypothetical protein